MNIARRDLIKILAGTSLLGLATKLSAEGADATIIKPTTAEVQAVASTRLSAPYKAGVGDPATLYGELNIWRFGEQEQPVVHFVFGCPGGLRWVAAPGEELISGRYPIREIYVHASTPYVPGPLGI